MRGREKALHSCVDGCLCGEDPWFQSEVIVSECVLLIVFLGMRHPVIESPLSMLDLAAIWPPPEFLLFFTQSHGHHWGFLWHPMSVPRTWTKLHPFFPGTLHLTLCTHGLLYRISNLQCSPGYAQGSVFIIMYAPKFQVFSGTNHRTFSDLLAVVRWISGFYN